MVLYKSIRFGGIGFGSIWRGAVGLCRAWLGLVWSMYGKARNFMLTAGDRAKVIDSDCRQLYGSIVTLIQRNPRCTAEWEVESPSGKIWVIHGCFLREISGAETRRDAAG